ncbi:hypothetical protein GCM10027059_38970 [Myceligenerans halotolerans]
MSTGSGLTTAVNDDRELDRRRLGSVWRRAGSLLVALVSVLALAGCSPVLIGSVGLTRTDDGELALRVVPCPGYPIREVTLEEYVVPTGDPWDWESPPTVERDVLFHWTPGEAIGSPTTVPLDAEVETSLRDGQKYWAQGGGEEATGFALFTSSDISSLQAGEILTRGADANDEETSTTFTDDEFVAVTVDYCP